MVCAWTIRLLEAEVEKWVLLLVVAAAIGRGTRARLLGRMHCFDQVDRQNSGVLTLSVAAGYVCHTYYMTGIHDKARFLQP